MHQFFGILLGICCTLSLNAQTFSNPTFSFRQNKAVKIKKIEITESQTVIHFVYVCPANHEFGGWACVSPNMKIIDTKTMKEYAIQDVQGIPMCEQKHYFNQPGERLYFRVYFEKIPYSTRYIHIVEEMVNAFNFYDVYLKPSA